MYIFTLSLSDKRTAMDQIVGKNVFQKKITDFLN